MEVIAATRLREFWPHGESIRLLPDAIPGAQVVLRLIFGEEGAAVGRGEPLAAADTDVHDPARAQIRAGLRRAPSIGTPLALRWRLCAPHPTPTSRSAILLFALAVALTLANPFILL
eukprot:scaffold4407_cov123-Isochrysis_galbana.AAC.6